MTENLKLNIKKYYLLAKPGIVYGNLVAAVAGFLLASRVHFDSKIFLGMILGMGLVMGSACVFNNYIDRDIDARMERTKKRALAVGNIGKPNAIIYGAILGIIGTAILFYSTNVLTVLLGTIGFIFYVIIYGIAKRKTVHGTIVGSISGSIPLVAGYTAVSNRFDMGALLLFLVLAIWQMPHFYALALYRVDEYKKAGLPVLPVVVGADLTKKQIVVYIIGFTITVPLLTYFHYTGYIYLIVILTISVLWLKKAVSGLHTTDNTRFGKGMFRFSLVVLLVFCAMIAIGGILP